MSNTNFVRDVKDLNRHCLRILRSWLIFNVICQQWVSRITFITVINYYFTFIIILLHEFIKFVNIK